jgi:hypothetical protein
MQPDLRGGPSVSDREIPLFTGVNGPVMARGLAEPRVDFLRAFAVCIGVGWKFFP